MELDIDFGDSEKGMKQLFSYAFMMNCNLDDESVTEEESKTLQELSPHEVLENFKDLVVGLLKFKKDFKTSDTAELAQKSEQFETMLQKLEAEVRNHIRIEHQLKLHIENHQHRIDELEKAEMNGKMQIKEGEDKPVIKKSIRTSDTDKLKKEFDEKVKNLLEIIDKKDKVIQKLEFENSKLRNLLEEKIRDFEIVKKELVKLSKSTPKSKDLISSGSSDKLRQKFELRKVCKVKAQNTRSDRKSMGETDFAKLSSPFLKKEKKEEANPVKILSKGHIRSSSEQKLLSSKRTTSR